METMVKYKSLKGKVADSKSIFIVDDDVSFLYPLVYYLQKNTLYKIYSFTSGEECMKNIKKLKPRLLVLDYNLNPQAPNVMNGPDVLKQIKNLSPKTKVVMLSSRDTHQAVVKTMELGAYSYIIKDTEAIMALRNIIHILCNDNDEGQKTGNTGIA
jgi:two-component system response regulator AtoC